MSTPALERIANAVRPAYQKVAGTDAPLGALPMALIRRVRGNYATLRIDGRPLRVDLRDVITSSEMIFLRRYERVETELVKRIVEPGNVCVDVGANIGYFAVLIGRSVGPEGAVIAVEPDAGNADLLEHNLALNGVAKRVTVVRAAVSDEDGEATLFRSSLNHGDHRMWRAPGDEAAGEHRTPATVAVRTLDGIVANLPRIDFVKMDIQGYEPRAIAGLAKTFAAERIATMLFEFWPSVLRAAGFDPAALIDVLRGHGMQMWRVLPDRLEPLDSLAFTETLRASEYANVFAAHPKLAAATLARLGL